MAKGLSGNCRCGYECSAFIGSVRKMHGQEFFYPHTCQSCSEVVNIDLLKPDIVCRTCSSDRVSRLGWSTKVEKKPTVSWFQRLFKRSASDDSVKSSNDETNAVNSSYCYNLELTFHLPREGNPCPKCGGSSLAFRSYASFD
jgi:hypothetical protein